MKKILFLISIFFSSSLFTTDEKVGTFFEEQHITGETGQENLINQGKSLIFLLT